MKYDILIKEENQELEGINHLEYVIIRNDLGEYDEEYTRNFIKSNLKLEEFALSILYSDYYSFDSNRSKSGEWFTATITGRILHKRDSGVIDEMEKMELESNYLNTISLISKGHWITGYNIALMSKPNLTSQKLKDMAQEYLDEMNEYILNFY